ncbi:MAG: ABC transporter permease [Deltaproteobacteria bacterium]|nr:ABC transporter permease [Deltaproteobacteria bacterium]
MQICLFPKTAKGLFSSPAAFSGAVILIIIIIMAMIGPFVIPADFDKVVLEQRLLPPGPGHILGCDLYGRDVFFSILAGAKISLYIAFITVFLTSLIGVALGLIAGYFRGIPESFIMRMVDVFMAFPGILLTMALASLFEPGMTTIIFAIAATGWTGITRIVRAQVLSLREREHIQAAKALGSDNQHILLRHIFPSIVPPVVITIAFSLSGIILTEASLSFLGIGNTAGLPTWGGLLNQGRTVLTEAPYLSIAPGSMILLLVLAFNFLGDALRDSLDPKSRS